MTSYWGQKLFEHNVRPGVGEMPSGVASPSFMTQGIHSSIAGPETGFRGEDPGIWHPNSTDTLEYGYLRNSVSAGIDTAERC